MISCGECIATVHSQPYRLAMQYHPLQFWMINYASLQYDTMRGKHLHNTHAALCCILSVDIPFFCALKRKNKLNTSYVTLKQFWGQLCNPQLVGGLNSSNKGKMCPSKTQIPIDQFYTALAGVLQLDELLSRLSYQEFPNQKCPT